MAVTINADTSNGLVMTPDTSGEIKLQSAGADIATVTSSGITMASGKGLSATGHVLQVVQGTSSTQHNTSSTSWVATDLSASITPSSTSSKILVLVSTNTINTNASAGTGITIFRNGTNVLSGGVTILNYYETGSATNSWAWVPANISYLDSPSTISSIEYKLYFTVTTGSGYVMRGNILSTITLLEVAG